MLTVSIPVNYFPWWPLHASWPLLILKFDFKLQKLCFLNSLFAFFSFCCLLFFLGKFILFGWITLLFHYLVLVSIFAIQTSFVRKFNVNCLKLTHPLWMCDDELEISSSPIFSFPAFLLWMEESDDFRSF